MKHIDNTSRYIADSGKFIVRKSDNFIMGKDIDLGSSDSIDNYKEEEYTEESYKKFYLSIGYNEEDIPSDDNKEKEE